MKTVISSRDYLYNTEKNNQHFYVCAHIIVVVRKLLPSRAFPVDNKSAGPSNMFIYSKRESSFNLLPLGVYLCKLEKHLANRTNH